MSAFPKEERQPLLRLWLLSALRPRVALTVYYEGETFCGFTLTVNSEKYLYISFIAVNPALRSQGIGGKILRQLQERYPGKSMLVEVETPSEGAENELQREKRMRFYMRNGFYDLNRSITGRGVTYSVLATDRDYDREAYLKIFEELSLGIRAVFQRLRGK